MISLAFSHDSKYLLAQGGSPDYRLSLQKCQWLYGYDIVVISVISNSKKLLNISNL